MSCNNSQNGCTETLIEKETILEKFTKRNVTESDSVHPRFGGTPEEKEVQEFQRKNDYFCPVCKDYFAPTLLALREHFKPGRIKHTFTQSCIYCKRPVYEYFINSREKIYHDCSEKEEAE